MRKAIKRQSNNSNSNQYILLMLQDFQLPNNHRLWWYVTAVVLCQMGKLEEPLSPGDYNRRLRLFGHIARSSPREDHHRALATCIRQVPPDWKRPAGRPASLGSVQLRQTLALWTLASRLPGERPLLVAIGDILWTQQRSSGVRSERRSGR